MDSYSELYSPFKFSVLVKIYSYIRISKTQGKGNGLVQIHKYMIDLIYILVYLYILTLIPVNFSQ